MTVRKRLRLVPEKGVEVMEVRIALYFDQDGTQSIAYDISNPDGALNPPLHEVLGTLAYAGTIMVEEDNRRRRKRKRPPA